MKTELMIEIRKLLKDVTEDVESIKNNVNPKICSYRATVNARKLSRRLNDLHVEFGDVIKTD